MDVMKNQKVAYCMDFVTVHHCTKFRSHICNIGDFTEGGGTYYKGPKSPVLIGLRVSNLSCKIPSTREILLSGNQP